MRREHDVAVRSPLAGALIGVACGLAVGAYLGAWQERYLSLGLGWLALAELRDAALRFGALGLGIGALAALPWLLFRGATERAARLARGVAALAAAAAGLWLLLGGDLFSRWLAETPLWLKGVETFGILLAATLLGTAGVGLARAARPGAWVLTGALTASLLAGLVLDPLWPRATGPNLLLISVDTLRPDRLGSYGYTRARTPSIDELARGGTLYETVIASAPVTLPATTTLLTGLDPQDHGAHYNGFYRVSPRVVTLAELLREHGYRTGAVIGNFALDHSFRIDQGFEHYDDHMTRFMVPGAPPRAPAAGGTWWTDIVNTRPFQRFADEITSAAIEWLQAYGDAPFFLWVHYMDPHKPYQPPPSYAGLDPYDGEVAFVDAEIGRLLADYRLRFPDAQTLVVFVADHGESLGEHGVTGHVRVLYEQTLRVPLILWLPGRVPRNHRVDEPLRGRDVPFEILDALGLPPGPFGTSPSGRVPPAGSSWWAYSETYQPLVERGEAPLRSLRTSRWKYIQQGANPGALFDLENDPGELVDRAPDTPGEARALSDVLALETPHGDAAPRPVDAETLERLRALGYVK